MHHVLKKSCAKKHAAFHIDSDAEHVEASNSVNRRIGGTHAPVAAMDRRILNLTDDVEAAEVDALVNGVREIVDDAEGSRLLLSDVETAILSILPKLNEQESRRLLKAVSPSSVL